ncbi:hypothetical protein [Salinithrix halophila]|uniref:YtxH domain-containing protein n=1 Tax=Salinithrix halophila TaxID=1485204 RepID=A0ABV8JDG0_9BACL
MFRRKQRVPNWKKILQSEWFQALTLGGAIIGGISLYRLRGGPEGLKEKLREKAVDEGRKQVKRKARHKGDQAAENLQSAKEKATRTAHGKGEELEQKLRDGLLKARQKLKKAKEAGESISEKLKSDDSEKGAKGANHLRGVNDIKGVHGMKSVRDIPKSDDIPHYTDTQKE